jgi:hypothetical protein
MFCLNTLVRIVSCFYEWLRSRYVMWLSLFLILTLFFNFEKSTGIGPDMKHTRKERLKVCQCVDSTE